jgi:hypothetical protein
VIEMAEIRWRQFECPECERVAKTRSERKILTSILLCDKDSHLVSDCENLWQCPAASTINQVIQWWSVCPFHGTLENHFRRVREMRGETVRIEAERKLGGWVELSVWSFSKRSGRILYSLHFTIYKHDQNVYVRVNDRDELFILPVRDFITYAPVKWIKEVLRAFTLPQPEPQPQSASAK